MFCDCSSRQLSTSVWYRSFGKRCKYSAASFLADVRSLVNFSRTKGSLGTTGPRRQKSLSRVTNENGPRWYAGRLDGAASWCGSETEDLETPAVVPPPPTYVPTPSQINWVTGRRLHALHSIRVAGVVNGWLTPIWQKLWTVASEPRPCHHASAAASSQSRQKFLNRPGAMSV